MNKLYARQDRTKEHGLLDEDFFNNPTVDEWEIPLKDIVINRELGKGDFGKCC